MKWFIIEEIPRCHYLLSYFPISGWADLSEYGVEVNADFSIIEDEKGTDRYYFVRERMDKSSRHILEKLLSDPAWAEGLNRLLLEKNRELIEFDGKLRGKAFPQAGNEGLAKTLQEHFRLQKAGHVPGMVWNTLEFDKPLLSNYLTSYLRGRIGKKSAGLNAAEVFSLLTTPVELSFAQKEEIDTLALATKIERDPQAKKLFATDSAEKIEEKLAEVSPMLSSELEKLAYNYCWLPYMYEGPAWKKSYFIEVLSGLLKHEDYGKLYEGRLKEKTSLKARQEEAYKKLGVDEKHKRLFEIASGIVFTKGYRKDAVYHGFYCTEPLLKEAAKRLGLTLKQLRRFTPQELVQAVKNGSADADELNERFNYTALYTDATKKRVQLLSGKKAREFMSKLELEKAIAPENARELKGECACPGFGRGAAKLVERAEEMAKMQKGDILVAHQTNPDIVPAMKKAAAIVTDLGGMTCHAAIVSRELRIPCVIGTKIATKLIKDGEIVEVDATHGIARKI